MNVLVSYSYFHWDNYQGGSGKYIDNKILIEVREDLQVEYLMEYILTRTEEQVFKDREFCQGSTSVNVKSIELLKKYEKKERL